MITLLATLAMAVDVPVQMRVLDNTGTPVSGTFQVDIGLYPSASATESDFSQGFTDLSIQDGYIAVVLDVPPSELRPEDLWIGVSLNGADPLQPLSKLASSPRTAEIQTIEASASLPAGGGEVLVDHEGYPSERVHVAVYRQEGSAWTPIPYGAMWPADERYGSGRDGDIVLDGGTHDIADLVYGYDGWSRILEVDSLVLQNGATLTVSGWDGHAFGRVMVRARERIEVCGTCSIDVTGKGYRGGAINPVNSQIAGVPGEGPGGGRAAAIGNTCGHGGGGGGAGYGTAGADGTPDLDRCNPADGAANARQWYGAQGVTYGSAGLQTLFPGSGGASGSEGHGQITNAREPGAGGNGGGAVGLWAPVISLQGTVVANGVQGTPSSWDVANPQVASGGAGSGGAIRLEGQVVDFTSLTTNGGARGTAQGWGTATNQSNGQRGGAGGTGRVAVFRESGSTGSTTGVFSNNTVAAGALAPVEACGHTFQVVDAETVSVDVSCAAASTVRVVVTALP